MADKIISLDDRRPRVVIVTAEASHVVPVSLVQKWADGKEVPPPDILGRIVTEWMEFVGAA